MSQVTLVLPWEAEQRLREKAGKRGLTLEAYLQRLAEQDAFDEGKQPTVEDSTTPPRTFDAILAPIRRGFEESGLTEEEINALLSEAREEVWRERRKEQS
jgi:hypothetical protein